MLTLAGTPAAGRAAEGPAAPGVFAWGENEVGQLGDGTTAEADAPVAVPGLSKATSLAIGWKFGLALLSDGTVESWGENTWGQLGDGTDTGPQTCHANFAQAAGYQVPCGTTPVPVTGLSDVIAIAAGAEHGLALLSNGTVMAWGDNESGQLGDGTQTNGDVPVAVHGLNEVVAIAADQGASLAVLKNGTVMSWGYDGGGDLGQGREEPPQDLPAPVSGLADARALAGFLNSNLALTASGTVMSWGENGFGELGDGTTVNSDVPVAVSGLNEVRAVARGEDSLALLANGSVMAWGSNISGQLGIGTRTGPAECLPMNFCSLTPVQVSELKDVRAIAAGSQHNMALLSNGEVMAWGQDWSGQLGTGAKAEIDTTVPAPVPGLIDVSEIAAGVNQSFAYGVLDDARPEVSKVTHESSDQMSEGLGSSAPQKPRPLVRLIRARLHGDVLLLTLTGTCASCAIKTTFALAPGNRYGRRASDKDDHVSHTREQPRPKGTTRPAQTKTVTLGGGAKDLTLKISLGAATRSLLRVSRTVALRVQCHEGATLVMDQTLRLKSPRPDR